MDKLGKLRRYATIFVPFFLLLYGCEITFIIQK
ncbi:hypothetical protein Spaf_1728 [Streptococcus parasanguinis FW213]|uniref:Lipoprotein n=1 Tax=Streptococcus parasanguinis FW213 TaxID=1114965 RepID=I1ZNQ8_STRPA|nr:hypothetical protein Spaf_1728 [Streptococcus parasanguinis FW213]